MARGHEDKVLPIDPLLYNTVAYSLPPRPETLGQFETLLCQLHATVVNVLNMLLYFIT
jgi:hypothetical protein